MKKILVVILSPVLLSTLVSAQTPGSAPPGVNERGQAESAKPEPTPVAKPDQSRPPAARRLSLPTDGELDKLMNQLPAPVGPPPRDPGHERGAYLALLVSIVTSQGNAKRARELAEEALPLLPSPYSDKDFYYRGVVHHALGNHDLATAYFDQALQLNPGLADVYEFRGDVYSNKNDYERALAEYDTAIKLNPGYYMLYTSRGKTYMGKGDYDRALASEEHTSELQSH